MSLLSPSQVSAKLVDACEIIKWILVGILLLDHCEKFKFDWSIISGKRARRWPQIFYFGAKVSEMSDKETSQESKNLRFETRYGTGPKLTLILTSSTNQPPSFFSADHHSSPGTSSYVFTFFSSSLKPRSTVNGWLTLWKLPWLWVSSFESREMKTVGRNDRREEVRLETSLQTLPAHVVTLFSTLR